MMMNLFLDSPLLLAPSWVPIKAPLVRRSLSQIIGRPSPLSSLLSPGTCKCLQNITNRQEGPIIALMGFITNDKDISPDFN